MSPKELRQALKKLQVWMLISGECIEDVVWIRAVRAINFAHTFHRAPVSLRSYYSGPQ